MDAIAFKKPILASKTDGIGIDIEEAGIGKTYKCGDGESLEKAYREIKRNYSNFVEKMDFFTEKYNNELFKKSISNTILNVLNAEDMKCGKIIE